MKRILLIALLTLGACSSETQDISATEWPLTGAAGSAAAVAATCTDAAYCSKSRSTIASYLGGTWTWGSACSDYVWQAQGPGGQTLRANRISGTTLYKHSVMASQRSPFDNICTCANGSTVSCSNNTWGP
jgi:hypothetical protein